MTTVILKVTESCNSNCAYCDVVRKKRDTLFMSSDVLDHFYQKVRNYLEENQSEKISVVIHGGEPFILGPSFYRELLDIQNKYCYGVRKRIEYSIQSNLTLVTREHLTILKELGINHIGTSYDPIPGLRGPGNPPDSRRYNEMFFNGLDLLEREGFGWGLIYVVTKLNLKKPHDIFNFLTNFCPDGLFSLNPVLLYDGEPKELVLTPIEYINFLGEIFPVWWEHRSRFRAVEPFAGLERNIVFRQKGLGCVDSGACADSHINIAPDGAISQCGRSSDWGILTYGSIVDTEISQAMKHPLKEEIRERNSILLNTDCKGCRFWEICHGGCVLDSWAAYGSINRKTPWCYARSGFITKYFEPITGYTYSPNGEEALESVSIYTEDETHFSHSKTFSHYSGNEETWINPFGGLGDALMISGVLKQVLDKYPKRLYNLITRTKYSHILDGHPIIRFTGHPPIGAKIISTAYWDHEEYKESAQRPYQILSKIFGLDTPVEERLYVPWDFENVDRFTEWIPKKDKSILICPASDSPKKEMSIDKWEKLVARLKAKNIIVVQMGRSDSRYVRGSFSLIGLTTPRQAISLIPYFDLVVTSDNFFMHAAHLCGVKAVVLWGPTDYRLYGYNGQVHIEGKRCEDLKQCSHFAYNAECPTEEKHCMDKIEVGTVLAAIHRFL